MSFAAKHNKGGIQWGVDTKDFEYFGLKDLLERDGEGTEYILKGLFINRNKSEKELKEYGPSVVAILDDCLVNLPGHLLEEVEGILKDEEDIESIKAGLVHFTIRTYESHGKTCYSPNWVDAE